MAVVQDNRTVAKGPSRTWSVPNLLTYGRILAVPAVVACFYLEAPLSHWAGCIVFTVASVTDFFDGYLARAWHQESRIGRMLDPIADKMLVGGSLFMLAGAQVVGGWSLLAGVIILGREFAVSGLREFLTGLQADGSVKVTWLAKCKTVVQMTAIAVLLLSQVADQWFPWLVAGQGVASFIGLSLLWLSAIVTLITGYGYFREGLRHT